MKCIKFFFAAICVLVLVNTARAQFLNQRDSRPITTIQYTDVEGSPYLYEDWMPGMVKLSNGVASSDKMQLKYNVVDDVLTFRNNETGAEMAFVQKVQEFTLEVADSPTGKTITKRYRNGFDGIEGTTPNSFFEILADGKAQLLKRFTRVVLETQDFGSASKKKNFIAKERYFIVLGGKALLVKNDKKSIVAALGDKQAQLEEYIKANKTNFKSDGQIGKLVDYYNTL